MKFLFSLSLGLGLLFTGCSSKQETIEINNNISQKNEVTHDIINNSSVVQESMLNVPKESRIIYLANSVYFDFDKFNIKASMQDTVIGNAELIKNHLSTNNDSIIVLEGNCDDLGTDEYNYALGLKRAISVKNFLLYEGIPDDSIKIKSLGESNPACTENTQECRAKNRRVVYIINK